LSETKSGIGLASPRISLALNSGYTPLSQGAAMITEIAQIEVKPGMEAEFEAGVKSAAPIFKRAKGCRAMELRRSLEKPARYRLFVAWETVENHTADFRGSADFQEWRKLVAHCFASPPEVEHVAQVLRGF
jgi:heme-degrading monooxygenase HmoA